MRQYTYLFVLAILLFNCSSEDDGNGDPNNIAPGPFSVTILETRMDGAHIEWTEAIDIDDDSVTYAVYLENELISTGGTALSYNFTGLNPEALYNGYILANDGNGGTSQTDFFFETEPESLILTVNASFWEKDRFPEGNGERVIFGGGFEIPVYDDATSYQVTISESGYVHNGVTYVAGNVYTWTNDSQSGNIEYIEAIDKYVVRLASASVNTINTSSYDFYYNNMSTATGEAEIIITFGDN